MSSSSELDAELFAPNPEERDKAHAVVRLLRAAPLNVPFGADFDDIEELIGLRFSDVPLATLLEAAGAWCADHDKWPTISQFGDEVAKVRRAQAALPAHRGPCLECNDDPPGWTYDLRTEDGSLDWETIIRNNVSARPCSTCRPKKWEAWRNGCYQTGHVYDEEVCNDACPKFPRDRRRR